MRTKELPNLAVQRNCYLDEPIRRRGAATAKNIVELGNAHRGPFGELHDREPLGLRSLADLCRKYRSQLVGVHAAKLHRALTSSGKPK